MYPDKSFGVRKINLALITTLLSLYWAGCGSDFDPFNLVDKTRILAIEAEPPALHFEESSNLQALVYVDGDDSLEYRWSWCPVTSGRATGYECALPEEEWRQILEALLPGAAEKIPPYDLGNQPTARYEHQIDPGLLQQFCDNGLALKLPSFVDFIDCAGGLDISVRLEITGNGETTVAVKRLRLHIDDVETPNNNPELGPIEIVSKEYGESLLPNDDPYASFELKRGSTYKIVAEIPPSSAELFTPASTPDNPNPKARRETLFMTWFITGGETEYQRTSFLDGEIPLEELGVNEWKAPAREDYPENQVSLFLVLQDERGGVTWSRANLNLLER